MRYELYEDNDGVTRYRLIEDYPGERSDTFIRREWTRYVQQETARQTNWEFVLDLFTALTAQCFLAFSLPVLLAEKYAAGLLGYTAMGRRFYQLLKECQNGQPK